MNGERGQALPLAILALTIGTLLIAPFLGNASSSIIGSRTYGEAIDYRSASDAGVEHAIWNLVYGGLIDLLPNPGDQITYQLPETLNSANITVTVTANATGGGTTGNITKTVIDSFDFDGTFANTPDIIHVSGNIYAIAYEGPASDGFLRTVEIAPDGNITNSAIDTLEFDTSSGFYPNIIQVSGSTYAIAYRGPANDGFLKTVTIAANGTIGDSVIDTLEFDTSNCFQPDIISITSTIYAIAYQGPGSDGFLTTVSIAANGDIGNSVIDTLEFDTADCAYPDVINVSGNVYAIAYQGSGNDGFLRTMTVSAAGDIGNSVIDTLEFDPTNGQEPQIIYVVGNIYAIAYDGPQNDGFIITLPVDADGNIPGTITDTFEYDTSNGYFPDIIAVADGIFAVAYCIPSARGSLVTIGILTSSSANTYRIVATAGDTTIQAYVNADNTTASIVSWQVQ